MTMVSIGDMARLLVLRRSTSQAKTDLQRLSAELATGRKLGLSRHLRGDFAPLIALEAGIARLDGWRQAADGLNLRLRGMQTALGAVDGIAQATAEQLLSSATSGQPALVTRAAQDAKEALDSAIGILNARIGERYLFAGMDDDRPALVDADMLLSALEPVVAGAATAADVADAIRQWFDDPAGFALLAYTGGAAQTRIPVGPEEFAAADATAEDPAVKATLAALAMAALVARDVPAGGPSLRQDMIQMAAEALFGSSQDRAFLAARLGATEARLDRVQARNASEAAGLEIARAGLIEADPYDTASALEATRIQLETLYTLTARLSGLSLARYLR